MIALAVLRCCTPLGLIRSQRFETPPSMKRGLFASSRSSFCAPFFCDVDGKDPLVDGPVGIVIVTCHHIPNLRVNREGFAFRRVGRVGGQFFKRKGNTNKLAGEVIVLTGRSKLPPHALGQSRVCFLLLATNPIRDRFERGRPQFTNARLEVSPGLQIAQ